MARILTIRDAKSGALIIEEQIEPQENEEKALLQLYRKALGPNAPEQRILAFSDAKWVEEGARAQEFANRWGSFRLALLGPQGEPGLNDARLVWAHISDGEPTSRMEFPIDRHELKLMREGKRRSALVPVKPDAPPKAGDTVRFFEAAYDPFGAPANVPNGDTVSVDLIEVKNPEEKWGEHDLYWITWNPSEVRYSPKRAPTHASR